MQEKLQKFEQIIRSMKKDINEIDVLFFSKLKKPKRYYVTARVNGKMDCFMINDTDLKSVS